MSEVQWIKKTWFKWGFPKIRGTFLGVPIIRTIVYWDLYWGPLILGSYQIGVTSNHVPRKLHDGIVGLCNDHWATVARQKLVALAHPCIVGFFDPIALADSPAKSFDWNN